MSDQRAPDSSPAVSPWAPLGRPLFRYLWIATVVSNIGSWMQDVGAGWLMTTLAPEPIMVALVQTATTLPFVLLVLPAGALADIIDRRRYLIAVQIWMLAVSATLGVLTLLQITNAWTLLVFTFALGAGTAMMMPAWSSIMPELVPREQLQPAIVLNSVGINLSRAIGPAVAGVIVSAVGSWAVFLLNALSYLGVIGVLVWWQREQPKRALPSEGLVGAFRSGLRFVWNAPALQTVLVRTCGFSIFASATWSLFPLIVRHELGRGSEVYGVLLACIGIGAVSGAMVLPRLRARFSRHVLVAIATLVYAGAALTLAYVRNVYVLGGAMFATGTAWLTVLSALQVTAQTALPAWVRARGLAVYMVVFMAGMAGGSALWGHVATVAGIPTGADHSRGRRRRRHRAHVALQAWRTGSGRSRAVDALAGAARQLGTRAGARPGDGDHRVPDRAGTDGGLRRGHAGHAPHTPARRCLFLGTVPGCRRFGALRRMFHDRVVGRAPAPARAGHRGRPQGPAADRCVSRRRRAAAGIAFAGRHTAMNSFQNADKKQ